MDDLARVFAQRKRNSAAQRIELPQAFTDKFPKLPPAKAEKLFRRYLDTVVAALLPKLPFLRDGETYLSLDQMINGCGEFQYRKCRYWVWNEFKDIYPLLTVVTTGSNLRAAEEPWQRNTKIKIANERLLRMMIDEETPRAVFDRLYDGVAFDPERLDVIEINMDNLGRYIGCTELELETAVGDKLRGKLQSNLFQAKLVQKVGQYTEELFGETCLPLAPKPSPFGRTYYQGLNVQNVSKQVRSAMLGHHFQYDVNAAAFAVKLYLYGQVCGGDNYLAGTRLGTYTREYLDQKSAIRQRLAKECFRDINIPDETALKAIKNALTAIGFGARASGQTWMFGSGRKGTALAELIVSPVARERFLGDAWVRAFLAEQRVIEDAILADAEGKDGYDVMCEVVRASNGANGRTTRAGKLAYVYQHYETALMDAAVEVLVTYGITPIARIHDAFITRDKLPVRVLDEIYAAWGLRSYLTLDCDEIHEWADPSYKRAARQADVEIVEHRRRMQAAEAEAARYRFEMVRRLQP